MPAQAGPSFAQRPHAGRQSAPASGPFAAPLPPWRHRGLGRTPRIGSAPRQAVVLLRLAGHEHLQDDRGKQKAFRAHPPAVRQPPQAVTKCHRGSLAHLRVSRQHHLALPWHRRAADERCRGSPGHQRSCRRTLRVPQRDGAAAHMRAQWQAPPYEPRRVRGTPRHTGRDPRCHQT